MLTKTEEMITFLELAESGATAKRWRRLLGFEPGDVRIHLRFIEYYRLYVEMYKEIMELQKQRREASTEEEKAILANEVRKVRTKYRPLLAKARSNPK